MDKYFEKVREYLFELGCQIVLEDSESGVFIIDIHDSPVTNMAVACDDPILVLEQKLFTLENDDISILKGILMKNREIIHGAFVLDETGKNVIFRDTLQLENLDLNELEGSLNSLEVLLSEYGNKILEFSHK